MNRERVWDTDQEFELALRHHQAGSLSKAEGLYRRIIQADPKRHDAHNNLGVLLEGQGRLEEAIASYRHALSVNPNQGLTLSNLGALLMRQDRLEEAQFSLERALALDPGHSEAHSNLGILLQHQGQLEEAKASYRRALALNPGHANTHNNLGSLLLGQGKLDEAFASLQNALALDPNHADAHSNLGTLLLRQGRLEDAFASLQKALVLNPNHADAHCHLGALLLRQGKREEAFASLQKALVLNPHHSDAYNSLGGLLQIQGRFDEAIVFHRRALSIRPDNISAHEDLGGALHHKGYLEEAAKCYRKAIGLGTTNPVTRHMLAALTGEDVGPIPEATVTGLFDDYAPRFDAQLVDVLGYAAPKLMREAVDRLRQDNRRFQHALDLGCGTGLLGAHFREIVSEIDGVDLSAKMLEQAGRRDIYGKLHREEIVAWLERSAGESLGFDLVLSADVFIYIGNLDSVFRSVREIMPGGGLFVFSVEYLAQGTFALLPTGRFAHSHAYIRDLASNHGFTVELLQQVDLRKETDAMIVGTVFVLKRAETPARTS